MSDKKQAATGRQIALTEIRAMIPFLLIANGVLLIIFCIAGYFTASLDFRIFTGQILGNLIILTDFYLIGLTADKALATKKSRRAQFVSNLSFGLRYIAMFIIYAVVLGLNLAAIFPAIAPLILPKLYYFLTAFRNKNPD